MGDLRVACGVSAVTGCLLLALSSSASAAPAIDNLFASGGGAAAWVKGDAPGDRDGQALRLKVPHAKSYAGADLGSLPSAAPTAAPSFRFDPSVGGSSAGSPRLAIAFSDGDYIYAMPSRWTARRWSTVGGSRADWQDIGASTCPALSNVTYARALSCHRAHGATVTRVDLIADGRWPFTVLVDDISYAGAKITHR